MSGTDVDTVDLVGATIVVPEDWWKVPLHPAQRRRAAVRSLVARQFRGLDNQPILRRGFETELDEVADEAAEHYGIVMYVSRQLVADVPMPISLIVRMLPAELAGMDQLHDELAGEDAVDVADLPSGRCLRRSRRVHPGKEGYGEPEASLTVDYWLEAPGGSGLLQLTFSSPLVMVADALTELFDAVTSTVSWAKSDQGRQ